MVYNREIKFTPAQNAILTTILYSDIFSFPLTKEELWHYLISKRKISLNVFDSSLQKLDKHITAKDGYYCLKNREEIIAERKRHLPQVSKKMKLAQSVCAKLSQIPSILFIGVSGGLAVGNVTAEDDIDLIIIVKKNTLFTSRVLILTVLESLGKRRHRKQKNAPDAICVNLLFDETALDWFAKYKNIYTAREISQIQPLFERESTYQKFLLANNWVIDLLPNATASLIPLQVQDGFVTFSYSVCINPFFESVSRALQMSWMNRHRTSETVTKHVLAFHPNDYRIKTLKQLRLKARELGLLTIF